ncbi:MAG: hypothetical protein JEY71_07620 [Sphaerochaeta sp.]|nr:hypothetical protein [Sphaerochaeta sp.]
MKEYVATMGKTPSFSSSNLIERKQIIEKLSLSIHHRTTIIQAPHGYGKSIAVGQFFASHPLAHAYMQLSTEYNHPKAFLTCLNSMLLLLLDDTIEQEGPPDEQISNHIHLLSKSDEERFLIFDNIEVLHHKHIAAWFAFLTEYLPKSVHMILIGTEVSVFPKTPKNSEVVLKISREVLALSKEEGKQLAERNAVEIDEDTLSFLLDQTWGSPLLVDTCFSQASTLNCKQVTTQLVELETRFVTIWEEIPKKIESAVYYIALLGEFASSNDFPSSKSRIIPAAKLLEEKSLFVEIDERGVAIMHPLFRSYVIKWLKSAKNVHTVRVINQAISSLLEVKSYREAITMVLEIEDYALATILLDEYSSELIVDGYVDFILKVIKQVPQQYIERYASLLLLEIISGIRKGWTAQKVTERIARIKSSRLRKKIEEIDLLSILDEIDLIFKGNFYRADKLINKLPGELSYLRPLLSEFISSLSFGPEEDLEEVYHHLQETLRTIGIKQNDALSIILLGQIGMVQLDLLLFEQARQSFNEALRLGYDEKTGYATFCSLAWIGKGMLSLYSGKKDEAESHLLQGLELCKGYSLYLYLYAQLTLAEYYIITGRHEEAVRLLRDAGKQAKDYDVTSVDDRIIEAMYTWTLRRVEDLPALEMWVNKQLQLEKIQYTPFFIYELEQKHVLRYYQMTGQTEKADALYASLQGLLQKQHRLLHSLMLDIEYGVFDPKQAALSNTQISEYHISTLVELYGHQPVPKEHTLTKRELEVLQLIGKGFLNKEIAQMMNITERTVKWHASQVYEKLQVSSRVEAVSEARKMGILT